MGYLLCPDLLLQSLLLLNLYHSVYYRKNNYKRFTWTLLCCWDGQVFSHQFLVLPECPTHVLKRDILTKLGTTLVMGRSSAPRALQLLVTTEEPITHSPIDRDQKLRENKINPQVWDQRTPGQAHQVEPIIIVLWDLTGFPNRKQYSFRREAQEGLISVQFSHSVVSDSLQPREPQHSRLPCPSPTPQVHPNPCPLSWWHHSTISSSVVPFSPCPQSFPASGSFPMSQRFTSGGRRIGVAASTSVPPVNTQDWSPLGWTGWISLQSKGLSRVFSNTTVQKYQFIGAQLSLQSNSHIHTWLLEKP